MKACFENFPKIGNSYIESWIKFEKECFSSFSQQRILIVLFIVTKYKTDIEIKCNGIHPTDPFDKVGHTWTLLRHKWDVIEQYR